MKKLTAILRVVPRQYHRELRVTALLSAINLLLDFISVILLVPIFAALVTPETAHAIPFLPKFILGSPVSVAIGAVLFFIVKNVLSARFIKSQTRFFYRLSHTLSVDLLKNQLSRPLLEAKSQKNSALAKDLIFVPNNFVGYVLSSIIQLVSEGLLLVLILGVSVLLNPKITLFLIVTSIVIIGGLYAAQRKNLNAIDHTFNDKYERNFSNLMNAVQGYAEIRTGHMERYFVEKFTASNAALNDSHAALSYDRLVKPKYTEVFLVVIIAGLFILSRYFQANHDLLIPFLLAACLKVVPSINRILVALTNLRSHIHTVDLLQKKAAVDDREIGSTPATFNDKIQLDQISFSYSGAALFKNVSLTVEKNSLVGIFGSSGNGKSTLANIICAMITPDSGSISYDGVQIGSHNRESFLRLIAYVPQAPFVLEGSIRDNLILDGTSVDVSILDEYLDAFALSEIINALPAKADTFIGSNGYTLSGGQLQRLAIIRALLRNPEILILDEATNQLDTSLGHQVMAYLRQIAKTRRMTIIAISHDKAELDQFCDRIHELENAQLRTIK